MPSSVSPSTGQPAGALGPRATPPRVPGPVPPRRPRRRRTVALVVTVAVLVPLLALAGVVGVLYYGISRTVGPDDVTRDVVSALAEAFEDSALVTEVQMGSTTDVKRGDSVTGSVVLADGTSGAQASELLLDVEHQASAEIEAFGDEYGYGSTLEIGVLWQTGGRTVSASSLALGTTWSGAEAVAPALAAVDLLPTGGTFVSVSTTSGLEVSQGLEAPDDALGTVPAEFLGRTPDGWPEDVELTQSFDSGSWTVTSRLSVGGDLSTFPVQTVLDDVEPTPDDHLAMTLSATVDDDGGETTSMSQVGDLGDLSGGQNSEALGLLQVLGDCGGLDGLRIHGWQEESEQSDGGDTELAYTCTSGSIEGDPAPDGATEDDAAETADPDLAQTYLDAVAS